MSSPVDFANNALVKLYLPPLLDLTQNSGTDIGYIDVHYGSHTFANDASLSGLYADGDAGLHIFNDVSNVLFALWDSSNSDIMITPLFCCSYNVVTSTGVQGATSSINYGLPFIRIKKGQPFTVQFNNPTGFSWDVHWHGLNTTADLDGASQVVEFGNATRIGPSYLIQQPPVNNNSALIWFHAHPMFYSSAQVTMGAFGLVDVVDDQSYIVNDGIFNYGDNYLMLYYVDNDLNSDGTVDKRNNYTDAWRAAYGVINSHTAVCWYGDVGKTAVVPTIQSMYSAGASSDGAVYFKPGSLDSSCNWQGVAGGNGKYVAVGLAGNIAVSTGVDQPWSISKPIDLSGANWSAVTNATSGKGVFVSISASGQLLYSYDGKNWKTDATGTIPNTSWQDLAYGDSGFVAVGYGTSFVTSTDGINWTQINSLPNKKWCGITFGGDSKKYVVVNNDDGNILWSSDAITWNSVHTAPDVSGWCHITSCVIDGSGVFVSLSTKGQAMYSTDGSSNWNYGSIPSNVDASWNALTCDGTFVGVGPSQIIYSASGQVWSSAFDGLTNLSYNWNAVTCDTLQDKKTYVALSQDGKIMNSSDGMVWNGASILDSTGWNAIIYDSSRNHFLAGGINMFSHSTDVSGYSWSNGSRNNMIIPKFNTAAFSHNNNGIVVAVSSDGGVQYSNDGINWNAGNVACLTTTIWNGVTQSPSVFWTGVTYDLSINKFCAVGFTEPSGVLGYAITSSDGLTWTKSNIKNYEWCNIVAGDISNSVITPGIVALSQDNYAAYSYNGSTWLDGNMSSVTNVGFWCPMAYGKPGNVPTYVSLANNMAVNKMSYNKGYSIYSNDGIHWQNGSGQDIAQNWTGVVYGDKFVAVSQGSSDQIQQGQIIYSSDGKSWTEAFTSYEPFTSISYNNGTYVALTLNGTLYYSNNGINWRLNSMLDATKKWVGLTNSNNVLLAYSDINGDISNNIYYSVDGIYWNYDYKTIHNDGATITWGGDVSNNFVAVATNSYIANTRDTNTWTKNTLPLDASKNTWNGITYGINYVAVGNGTNGSNGIIYSPDSVHWFDAIGVSPSNWRGVAYGNIGVNMYTAVSQSGAVAYSYDGITWNNGVTAVDKPQLYEASANWIGVAYGNNVFAALGLSGEAMYSPDGINWQWSSKQPAIADGSQQTQPPGYTDITFGNGAFVGVCPNGQTVYSPDGDKWTLGILSDTSANWSAITYNKDDQKMLAVSSNQPPKININPLKPPYVQPMYHYTSQNLVKIALANITDSFRSVYLGVADADNVPQKFWYIQSDQGLRNPVKTDILNVAPANRGSIIIDLNDFKSDVNNNGLKTAYLFFYNFDLTNVFAMSMGADGNLYASINYDESNNTVFPTPMPDKKQLFGSASANNKAMFPNISYTTNNLLSYTNQNPDEVVLIADGNKPLPSNYNTSTFSKKLFLRISQYDTVTNNNYPFNSNILTTRYQTPTVSLSTVIDNIRQIVFGSNYSYISKFKYMKDENGNSLLDSPLFEYNAPFNYIKYLNQNYYYNVPDVLNAPIRQFAFYPLTTENYFDPNFNGANNAGNNNYYGCSDIIFNANRALVDLWNDQEINQTDAINQWNALLPDKPDISNNVAIVYHPPNLPTCLFKIQATDMSYININMLGNDTLYVDVFDISNNPPVPNGYDNSMNNYPYYSDATNQSGQTYPGYQPGGKNNGTTSYTQNPFVSTSITFPPTVKPLNIQEWVDLVNLQFSQTMICTCTPYSCNCGTAICGGPSCMKPLSDFLTMDWSYFPYTVNWIADGNGNQHKNPVTLNQVMVNITNISNQYFFRFTGKWELLNFFGTNLASMYMNPPGPVINQPGTPMISMNGPQVMDYSANVMQMNMGSCCGSDVMTMPMPMGMPDFSNNINYAVQTIYTVYPDPMNKFDTSFNNGPGYPGPMMTNMNDIVSFAVPPKDFNDPYTGINYKTLPGDNNGIYKGFIDGYANDNLMNFSTKVDSSEKWIYYNMDAQDSHPFHFHLTSGYVNPNDPINTELIVNSHHSHTPYTYSKDTYSIPSQTTLAWYLKFSNYTSNFAMKEKYLGFMYHCHYMTHHDMMMMGQYYNYENRNDHF